MPEVVIIDEEVYEVNNQYANDGTAVIVDTDGGEFMLVTDAEIAGQIARERWEDMAENDPSEFAAIIGEERLIKWALGQSDSYGFSSLSDFLDTIESVPEEELAAYDSAERDVSGSSRSLRDEWGFVPTVAYRTN